MTVPPLTIHIQPDPEMAGIHHLPSGQIIAVDVSEADYMALYAEQFCELVNGVVIKHMPVHEMHDLITQYFILLFNAYFALRSIGQIRHAPFVQKLEQHREPDVMVILNDNSHELKLTFMDGPADICIEVVSPDSVARDYGEKLLEYEKGGVREYWIFDPIRSDARFYRRDTNGIFQPIGLTVEGDYITPLLPGLRFNVARLWQTPLPDYFEIGATLKGMLGEE